MTDEFEAHLHFGPILASYAIKWWLELELLGAEVAKREAEAERPSRR